jgi:hypothetical protein
MKNKRDDADAIEDRSFGARLPRFTAEFSLYWSRTHYRTTGPSACRADQPDYTGATLSHPRSDQTYRVPVAVARQMELSRREMISTPSVLTYPAWSPESLNRLRFPPLHGGAARGRGGFGFQPTSQARSSMSYMFPPPTSIYRLPPSLYEIPVRVRNGVLVNIMTDRANCGACGHNCGDDGTGFITDDDRCFCDTGACACRAYCLPPWATSCGTDCVAPGQCKTWRCRDLGSDPNNCGSCGHVCNAGESCCAGTCVNLLTDVNTAAAAVTYVT